MTAPDTPGQRVTNPPTPLAGAADVTDRHLRVVHDDPPLPRLACLKPLGPRSNCFLSQRHTGTCLPLPAHWAVPDITRDNPRYRKAAS